jgi:hypothetical protein
MKRVPISCGDPEVSTSVNAEEKSSLKLASNSAD